MQQPIQFSSGRLPYALLIVCSPFVHELLVIIFGYQPYTATLSVWLSSALFLLGLYGLLRPRLVTLDTDSLTLRPTFGREQRWIRSKIISAEEIVSPPFGSLIARVSGPDGRPKAVTLSNRLALAGLAVRHNGREVGIIPSSRLSLVQAWLKNAL